MTTTARCSHLCITTNSMQCKHFTCFLNITFVTFYTSTPDFISRLLLLVKNSINMNNIIMLSIQDTLYQHCYAQKKESQMHVTPLTNKL